MAAKHKAFTGALFRAIFAQKSPLPDSISSWKGSFLGGKIHTTAAKLTTSSEGPTRDERNDSDTGFRGDKIGGGGGGFRGDRIGGGGGVFRDDRIGDGRHMTFVKGALDEDRRQFVRGVQRLQHTPEEKLDVVHIKMIRNNTFVTITDSKGNKKAGASVGCIEELKGGGPKNFRHSVEATAEHVGRLAQTLGLKSVVMRVNGFTHFKRKRQAILSWKEGYAANRGDLCPIAYIEDTTRRPHNGCRLRKKRRY